MNLNKINKAEVGYRIKIVRKDMGLTQTQLGEKLDVTYQTIVNYEKGENIDVDLLNNLSTIMGVPVSYLLAIPLPTQPLVDTQPKPQSLLSKKVLEVATMLNSLDECYHDHYHITLSAVIRHFTDRANYK